MSEVTIAVSKTTADLRAALATAGFFKGLWISATLATRASGTIMLAANDVAELASDATAYGKAVIKAEIPKLVTTGA